MHINKGSLEIQNLLCGNEISKHTQFRIRWASEIIQRLNLNKQTQSSTQQVAKQTFMFHPSYNKYYDRGHVSNAS
jgi:hypothetical protein